MPMYRVVIERWTCEVGSYEVFAEYSQEAEVLAKYKAMDDPEQYDGHKFDYFDTQYKTHRAVTIETPKVEDKPKPVAKKKSGRPKKDSDGR
jgi:hypothetical protein